MNKQIRWWRRLYARCHALRTATALWAVGLVSVATAAVAAAQLLGDGTTPVSTLGFSSLLLLGVLASAAAGVLLRHRGQARGLPGEAPSIGQSFGAYQSGHWAGVPAERWHSLEVVAFGQDDLAGDTPPNGLCGRLGLHGIGLSRTSNLADSPQFDAWLDHREVLRVVDEATSDEFDLPVSDRLGSIGHIDRYAGHMASQLGPHRREIVDLRVTVQRTPDGVGVHLRGMTGPLVVASAKAGWTSLQDTPNPYAFDLTFEINANDLPRRVNGEGLAESMNAWLKRTSGNGAAMALAGANR